MEIVETVYWKISGGLRRYYRDCLRLFGQRCDVVVGGCLLGFFFVAC